jgi:VanZ family protein
MIEDLPRLGCDINATTGGRRSASHKLSATSPLQKDRTDMETSFYTHVHVRRTMMISFLIAAFSADPASYTKKTMHFEILIRNQNDTCMEMAQVFIGE